jgi:hypothetical protein
VVEHIGIVVAPFMPSPQYTPASGCEAALDKWCNTHCPHAQHEPLFARIDVNAAGQDQAWRCYATSTLSEDLMRYERGSTYCTRHPQLREELKACLANKATSEGFDSETEYGPSKAELEFSLTSGTPLGDTATAGARTSPPLRATARPGPAASKPSQPETAPIPAKYSPIDIGRPPSRAASTCVDSIAECGLWARYDECRQNPDFMRSACPISCNSCPRAGGAIGTPPTLPPPPPPSAPPPVARPPSSSPDDLAKRTCRQPCDTSAGVASACSGRGKCLPWKDRQWCICEHKHGVRHVGLECEKALGEGITCGPRCAEHGVCVHGFCECDAGWHGPDCSANGAPGTFLTIKSLHEAGLLRGRKGSRAASAKACDSPSWNQAYERNSTLMHKLVASLPDEHPPLQCDTCALVSNAGSLLDAEHGAAIDANDCVWRMNRGPTQGFEKHVGRRTTLDYVNSFPHLRNLNILPRKDTPLLHGMTIEPFEGEGRHRSTDTGFDKYMGWVSGHASFKQQHPAHEAYVLDLQWLMSSWEAYWAYLSVWLSPRSAAGAMARPSSGWHMARLALARCERVRLYGFSMASSKFHYFDSLVQEMVTENQRSPQYGTTHRFAWEHEVFLNWTRTMGERVELIR